MSLQTVAIAAIAVVYFLIRYFNRTDVPKIKGLPEIPGIPIFGNLIQLGDQHATVAAKWAKKFGPVFQVRMGNRVSLSHSKWEFKVLTAPSALFSPILSTLSVSSGLRISPPLSPDPHSTPSTALFPALRDLQSELRPGMSPASVAARLPPRR